MIPGCGPLFGTILPDKVDLPQRFCEIRRETPKPETGMPDIQSERSVALATPLPCRATSRAANKKLSTP
jgi:hypothetical protein